MEVGSIGICTDEALQFNSLVRHNNVRKRRKDEAGWVEGRLLIATRLLKATVCLWSLEGIWINPLVHYLPSLFFLILISLVDSVFMSVIGAPIYIPSSPENGSWWQWSMKMLDISICGILWILIERVSYCVRILILFSFFPSPGLPSSHLLLPPHSVMWFDNKFDEGACVFCFTGTEHVI